MLVPPLDARSLRQARGAMLLALGVFSGCALWQPAEREPEVRPPEQPGPAERSLVVTASAYNSVRGQTDGNPSQGAWGDRLTPGMRAIAVSRDLLDLGLTRGTPVRIEGLPGDYTVLDKMGRRWRKHIDIYMGMDVQAARDWGRRQVRIYWGPRPGD